MSNTITSILQGVTYPILTSLQNEREKMVSVYSRLMRVVVFFVIPLLTLFAILAEPFVRFLLTEKWMPVVPLIQWLCFARMVTPISALNMNILNAIGRSDLFLKVDLTKLPMVLITMAITVPMGINIVVMGNFFTSFISFFINAYFPGKLFGFGAFRQIKEMRFVIYATVFMALIVFMVTRVIPGDLFKLFGGVVFGIAAYLGAAHLLRIEELKELNSLALQFIRRKTKRL
jgi:O-antigen/teichoic acid export membrane protein